MIAHGIKTTENFIVPVLIKKSFIRTPRKNDARTEFTSHKLNDYPLLELTEDGLNAARAGFVHILNGRHRHEAVKIASEKCRTDLPQLASELSEANWRVRQNPNDSKSKQAVIMLTETIQQYKKYVKDYDDKWLVVVYDQGIQIERFVVPFAPLLKTVHNPESIEKAGVKGALVVQTLSRNMDVRHVPETPNDRLQWVSQTIVDERLEWEETHPARAVHWGAQFDIQDEPSKAEVNWNKIEESGKKGSRYEHLLLDQEMHDICHVLVCGKEHFRSSKDGFFTVNSISIRRIICAVQGVKMC